MERPCDIRRAVLVLPARVAEINPIRRNRRALPVENIRQICQNIAKYPSNFPKFQSKFRTRRRRSRGIDARETRRRRSAHKYVGLCRIMSD